jgi:hypothetical protein
VYDNCAWMSNKFVYNLSAKRLPRTFKRLPIKFSPGQPGVLQNYVNRMTT